MQLKKRTHNWFGTVLIAGLLATAPVTASETEGFVKIFNGKDLEGWVIQGLEKAEPEVEDGILKVDGWDYWAVITEKEYGDFALQFDIRMIKNSNSGVLIHTPKKEVFKKAFEIQLADDQSEGSDLKPSGTLFTDDGAFYEVEKVVSKPLEEWNHVLIQLKDNKLTFVMNGKTVYENLDLTQFGELEGLESKGRIAFQRDDYKKGVWLKNIMIKPLD